MRTVTFIEAIRLAQEEMLREDKNCFLIGEGVPDEKAIFGTTKGLKEQFPSQVFDSPVSEAGVTGICLGASLNGMKPIMTFQRIDFSLYAMDQIINNAAKWKTMFGEQGRQLPFVMRMTVGRGWGQGVQHSQNLEALFAHIPGLRVVVPHDPCSAYWLLKGAIQKPDPTIFIEHRWLHNMKGRLDDLWTTHLLGKDLTIVAWGPSAQLALENHNYCDVHILNQLNPLNIQGIIDSVIRTRKLLVVSDDWASCGVAAEIVARCCEFVPNIMAKRISCPDRYVPSSQLLSDNFYPSAQMLVKAINDMTGRQHPIPAKSEVAHDVDPYVGKVTSLI